MTIETVDALVAKGRAARAASRQVARLSTRIKDRALLNVAEAKPASLPFWRPTGGTTRLPEVTASTRRCWTGCS